ncbi:MAG TPA: ATP-binding cassette domain-containing protein [Candidatus Krumholzibacteria bacterium]|nr:ATP-binding cassette domain-containing protein [Candidatus Krumholzibacteria bacterium]
MIRVENLSKDYGPVRALDAVSFEVGRQQILGFLGPNGAGKSTAMKIITTYLAPTAGKVLVDGIDVTEDPIAVRRRIGYLPETNPLYMDMRADDYLRFCGQARGLRGEDLRRRFDFVVEAAGIGHVLKKQINQLSKGFRQRTGLAQALIHDPPVLILDEPTSGLDPLQIIEIRRLIQELAREKTIIFSTHILSEISSTTDDVIIINNGRAIAKGRIRDLQRDAHRELPVRASLVAPRDAVEDELQQIAGVEHVSVLGEREGHVSVEFRVEGDIVAAQRMVGERAREHGWTVLELGTSEVTLEEVFISLVQRSKSHDGRPAAEAVRAGVSHG